MVEETIRTIKETENEAEGIIKKADAACTEILEKAKAEAAQMVGRAEADAKAKAAADFLAGAPLKKYRYRHPRFHFFYNRLEIDHNGIKQPKQENTGGHRGNGRQRKHLISPDIFDSLL